MADGRRHRAVRRRLPALVAVGLAALIAGGCGVGAGAPAGETELAVTRDFGAVPVAEVDRPATEGADTVMRLLERNAKVKTSYGGGFVQSINGVSGGKANSSGGSDWFFYVNGLLSDKGAASVKVRSGMRIWWDHHRWSSSIEIPVVVGSFPEPFLSGFGDGRRHPVRLECGTTQELCSDVQSRFGDLGIPASIGEVSSSFTKQTLRVLIGPWSRIGGDMDVFSIGRGPRASGVFAVPSADGRTIRTLDETGKTVHTFGPGTGLIATVRRAPERDEEQRDPAWVITGTDEAGVRAAVDALDEGALANRFAVVIRDGRPIGVPERR